jgi:DNA repair protein SbcC/Rad50
MKIAGLEIRGFQSHTDTKISFSEGLNVITGPSDSGKTALLRLVRWIAFNEPSGAAYVNRKPGEPGTAEGVILLENGGRIRKTRTVGKDGTGGKTSYGILVPGAPEETVYEKAEVPFEVVAMLGITKQTFGDYETALNFAYQLEAPFLISETPSAGAKILGKLAGTEAVDLAVRSVSKDTHGARNERSTAEKEIVRLTGQLLEYTNLGDQEKLLEAAQEVLESVVGDADRVKKLTEIVRAHSLAAERRNESQQKLEGLQVVEQAAEVMEGIKKAQQRHDTLLELFQRFNSDSNNRLNIEAGLQRYSKLDEASELIGGLDGLNVRLASLLTVTKEYTAYTEQANKSLEIVEKLRSIDDVDLDTIEGLYGRRYILDDLETKHRLHRNAHRAAQERLDDLRVLGQAEDSLNAAGDALVKLTELKATQQRHGSASDEAQKHSAAFSKAEANVQHYQQELEQCWSEAGGICPLCDQPVGEGHTHA